MTTARLLDLDDTLIDTRAAMVASGARLARAPGIPAVTSLKEVVRLLVED